MKYGLISDERYEKFCKKRDNLEKEIARIKAKTIKPTKELEI